MGRFTRRPEIDRKRRRRAKIGKLKQKMAKTQDKGETEKLMAKIRRIHPFYPFEQAA